MSDRTPFGASMYVAALDRVLNSADPEERATARRFMRSFAADYHGDAQPVFAERKTLRDLITEAIDSRLENGPPPLR